MNSSRRRPAVLVALALLVLQSLGGGAVTLAHARDVVTAPAAFEAAHDAGCPVLHDVLRCALCQYAGARFAVPATTFTPAPHPTRAPAPSAVRVVVVSSTPHSTAPARAPPTLLS